MTATTAHPLVVSFLGYCKVECGLSHNTVAAYRADLASLARFLGERFAQPKALTEWALREYLADMGARGLSPATCNRHRMTMVRFFQFIGTAQADSLDPAKSEQRLPKPISKDGVRRMIESTTCPYDRLVLDLLYCCGLRASELQDVQLDGEMIRVVGKGDKERIVPCPASVRESIRQHGHIVKTYTRFQVYNAVQRAGKRADIDAHPHQLRHSFATHLLEGGANLLTVSELLGHSCVETTQVYTKVDIRNLKETIREYHPRP
jgi:integrase/recombinase XerD